MISWSRITARLGWVSSAVVFRPSYHPNFFPSIFVRDVFGICDVQIYGVSWEGQILCRYGVIAIPAASPRTGRQRGPRSSPTHTRFADVCASSMSFNDTLQVNCFL